jgi:hypothetical protein
VAFVRARPLTFARRSLQLGFGFPRQSLGSQPLVIRLELGGLFPICDRLPCGDPVERLARLFVGELLICRSLALAHEFTSAFQAFWNRANPINAQEGRYYSIAGAK